MATDNINKMATSLKLGFDPMVLPNFVERKGSLFLRSDHKKYNRATLANGWHAARESEPKDYDISTASDKDRNLLLATYNRVGNMTEATSFPATTTQEAMNDGQQLKDDYTEKQIHKRMISQDNFSTAKVPSSPEHYGYGSILPHHNPDHDKRHLETTQKIDYRYPHHWSPSKEDNSVYEDETTTHRRKLSEFTDTANHRHTGANLWQDYRHT